jgi:hypothetical protein
MSDQTFVESHLVGFFPPGFVAQGRVPITINEAPEGMLAAEATPPAEVHDARQLQADAQRLPSFSEAKFFDEHGFVLLPHESAVQDWDVDPTTPDSELAQVYLPEIEELVRTRLLPGRRLDVWQGPPVRRGPGTPNPEYAGGVHQDFGLTPDDYQELIEVFTSPELGQGWRSRFDMDEVEGFVSVDFWRTAGMSGPLQHMPLALCHPASVRVEDVVPIGLLDFTPSGKPTNQSGLRYAEDQRWFYYPEMTPHEVLAFKQFEFFKAVPEPAITSCFHSAFELPNAPDDAEIRQSSEQRALIFCLKD